MLGQGKRIDLYAVVLYLLFGCASDRTKQAEIDYLGQQPPGDSARLFAPGVISTDAMEHSAPAFSPDGTVVLWTVVPDGFSKPAYFLEMNYEDNKWSSPHRVSFNDSTADDYYPSFAPSGKTLFFASRRKLPIGYTQNGDIRIWQVERKHNGWGTPVPIDTAVSGGHEFAHSITKDGNIFFSAGFFSDALNGKTGWSIYRSNITESLAEKVIILPYSINSMGYEDGPFVAPDESFLIFESERPEGMGGTDLYISFNHEGNGWSRPVNMGSRINTAFSERFARVSPDGKYLFFGSSKEQREGHPGFDIYWIDATIIKELKEGDTAQDVIKSESGAKLLTALDNGRWSEAKLLLTEWLADYPNDTDAIFNYALMLKKEKKYREAKEFLINNANRFHGNVSYALELALLNIALNNRDDADKGLAPLLAEKEQQWNRYIYLSSSLFEMGHFNTSDEYFGKAMSVNMWNYGYYKRACAYATIGEQDRAFENLSLAVENGFNNKQHFESDAELEPLRSNLKWKKLTANLK